jgi:hypothetical protein
LKLISKFHHPTILENMYTLTILPSEDKKICFNFSHFTNKPVHVSEQDVVYFLRYGGMIVVDNAKIKNINDKILFTGRDAFLVSEGLGRMVLALALEFKRTYIDEWESKVVCRFGKKGVGVKVFGFDGKLKTKFGIAY